MNTFDDMLKQSNSTIHQNGVESNDIKIGHPLTSSTPDINQRKNQQVPKDDYNTATDRKNTSDAKLSPMSTDASYQNENKSTGMKSIVTTPTQEIPGITSITSNFG